MSPLMMVQRCKTNRTQPEYQCAFCKNEPTFGFKISGDTCCLYIKLLGRALIHVLHNPSATEGYLSWGYLSKKLEFFTPYKYR